MQIKDRVNMAKLLLKINKNSDYASSLGIYNNSKFKEKRVCKKD